MKNYLLVIAVLIAFGSCKTNNTVSDAYGNFEADDWTVSSETSGKITRLLADEGDQIKQGDTLAIIDTLQLYLKKKQLEASIAVIRQKLPDKASQVAVYDEQLTSLAREVNRVTKLIASNAATTKQLDDLNSQVNLVKKQKAAAISGIDIQSKSLLAEIEPLRYQLLQTTDMLDRSIILSPQSGTILTRYVSEGEVLNGGKPVFQAASLDPIHLRAYVTGKQLPEIKLGQTVTVKTDNEDGTLHTDKGTIIWISDQAEFTPKTIQTRDERVTQVYAIKIKVPNTDNRLKSGMPGEVEFAK